MAMSVPVGVGPGQSWERPAGDGQVALPPTGETPAALPPFGTSSGEPLPYPSPPPPFDRHLLTRRFLKTPLPPGHNRYVCRSVMRSPCTPVLLQDAYTGRAVELDKVKQAAQCVVQEV